jgi:hypothetical protein
MLPYDTQTDPPAPVVPVQVIYPDTGASLWLRGKIDSGAAMSVLPQTAVAGLALEPTGDILASGYFSLPSTAKTSRLICKTHRDK